MACYCIVSRGTIHKNYIPIFQKPPRIFKVDLREHALDSTWHPTVTYKPLYSCISVIIQLRACISLDGVGVERVLPRYSVDEPHFKYLGICGQDLLT